VIVYVNVAGCANTCRHCSFEDRHPCGSVYTLEQMFGLADVWGPLIPHYDPAVHPEFPQIMDPRVSSCGGVLRGNGVGIARAEDPATMLAQLRTFGYTQVLFVLHGVGETHDRWVSRKGAYQDILVASARVREAGLTVRWEIMLDKRNLEQIGTLVNLSMQLYGGSYGLGVVSHRVGKRTWRYEQNRPGLADIERRLPNLRALDAATWNRPLSEFTESSWLRAWKSDPASQEFYHLSEPREWPLGELSSQPNLRILILRDRKVYFDPMCAPKILLGDVSEPRDALLSRMYGLKRPPACIGKAPADSAFLETDLLHLEGFSVRYKAISRALYGEAGGSGALA
jgi:hypothetical protein